jgi:hypothetical protein
MTRRLSDQELRRRAARRLADVVATLRALAVTPPAPPKQERRECGAHARTTGRPCKAPGIGRGGRCRRHGGASTGPRTPDGMARALENLRRGRGRTKR